MLRAEEFREVIRNTPLVSIDLLLRNPEGSLLLGERTNEPAKGLFFVPGGRIRKDEKIAAAYSRLLLTETGLSIPFAQARLFGVYEHFYETNALGDPAFGTHYVVLAYELRIGNDQPISLQDQHSTVLWAPRFTDRIHPYNEAYFA